MTRRERALRRLAARRDQELSRVDVELLIGVMANRLAGITALPEQPGLETVHPAYLERVARVIEKLMSARDNWIGA